MKKAVSILLTIAMCMGMLFAIVPTVSATEPEPAPSGVVYYENNFNALSIASLVDSDCDLKPFAMKYIQAFSGKWNAEGNGNED